MDRRLFLQKSGLIIGGLSGLAGLSFAVPKIFKSGEPGVLPLTDGTLVSSPRFETTMGRWSFGVIDEKGRLLREWETNFPAHQALQNPKDPDEILLVEKGNNAQMYNIKDRSKSRFLLLPPDTYFYGHSAFLDDAKIIAVSLHRSADGLGFIQFYDSQSLKPLSQIESRGFRPHDLQMSSSDPNLLLVANRGAQVRLKMEAAFSDFERPSLVTLDWRTNTVVINTQCADPIYGFGHFNQVNDGSVLIYGQANREDYEEGGIQLRTSFARIRPGDQLVEPVSKNWPQEYWGEILNAFVDEKRNHIWVGIRHGGKLLVLDGTDLAVLEEIPLREPAGMVWLPNYDALLVSNNGLNRQKALISLKDQVRVEDYSTYLDDFSELSLESYYGIHSSPFVAG